ncbi:MAG TPA: FtsQ-type POTRA domain-containing protein, partial [Candidatus Omnitrophota bacterium]|nr:FtsQ-type POTRA domain-containing protein [Candidatus Omnitrophota bacterium]
MRRMSSSDIVVTADDRIASSAPASPRRTRGAARDAEPKAAKTKAKRKIARPRFDLTPLQKLAAGGVAVTALLVGSAVIWHSGIIQRTAHNTVASILDATARAGFAVADITVSGRTRTPTAQIVAALGAKHGDPILGVDISVVKDRLEAIDSVRAAAVERRLPGSIHIAI